MNKRIIYQLLPLLFLSSCISCMETAVHKKDDCVVELEDGNDITTYESLSILASTMKQETDSDKHIIYPTALAGFVMDNIGNKNTDNPDPLMTEYFENKRNNDSDSYSNASHCIVRKLQKNHNKEMSPIAQARTVYFSQLQQDLEKASTTLDAKDEELAANRRCTNILIGTATALLTSFGVATYGLVALFAKIAVCKANYCATNWCQY